MSPSVLPEVMILVNLHENLGNEREFDATYSPASENVTCVKPLTCANLFTVRLNRIFALF